MKKKRSSIFLSSLLQMRSINKVGVWPVGLVGGLMVEKPIIDQNTGRVIGWNSRWRPERDFPIDMAGFAVNLQHLLRHPEAEFTFNVERGFQESALLSKLVSIQDLEPKADNCTKVSFTVFEVHIKKKKKTYEMN